MDKRGGELSCLRFAKRTNIECQQRTAAGAATPSLIQRVSVYA